MDSKFEINNKVNMQGISLDDLQKEAKTDDEKKIIASVFEDCDSNNNHTLDAQEQVSLFAKLKKKDTTNDYKIDTNEFNDNEHFKAWEVFTNALKSFLTKHDEQTEEIVQNVDQYYVSYKGNTDIYDIDGKYKQTYNDHNQIVKMVDDYEDGAEYTFDYGESTDSEAEPVSFTIKPKNGGPERKATKMQTPYVKEGGIVYDYQDQFGNIYDKNTNFAYVRMIEKEVEGKLYRLMTSQEGAEDFVPNLIEVIDNSDPQKPLTIQYVKQDNGTYKNEADGSIYSYNKDTGTLVPFLSPNISGDGEVLGQGEGPISAVRPSDKLASTVTTVVENNEAQKADNSVIPSENTVYTRPNKKPRWAHLPKEWKNNQKEMARTLELNKCNTADEVIDKILAYMKLNLSSEQREDLKTKLIKYNPSMFNLDGLVHSKANFDCLDFPKTIKVMNGFKRADGLDDVLPQTFTNNDKKGETVITPPKAGVVPTEEPLDIKPENLSISLDDSTGQEHVNKANEVLLEMVKEDSQLKLENIVDGIKISLPDGRYITVEELLGEDLSVEISFDTEKNHRTIQGTTKEDAGEVVYNNVYVCWTPTRDWANDMKQLDMVQDTWSNIEKVVKFIIEKAKAQSREQ